MRAKSALPRRSRGFAHRLLAAAVLLAWPACSPPEPAGDPSAGSYGDLETLFADWREFEAPHFVGGVPDY